MTKKWYQKLFDFIVVMAATILMMWLVGKVIPLSPTTYKIETLQVMATDEVCRAIYYEEPLTITP